MNFLTIYPWFFDDHFCQFRKKKCEVFSNWVDFRPALCHTIDETEAYQTISNLYEKQN